MNKPPPPPPPQPTTKKIAIAEVDPSASLETVIREMRALRETVERLGNQMIDFSAELSTVKERQGRHSDQTRGISENDKGQDAAIAAVMAEQAASKVRDEAIAKALADNTVLTAEIRDAARGAMKHPAFTALIMALALFLTAWLQRHT